MGVVWLGLVYCKLVIGRQQSFDTTYLSGARRDVVLILINLRLRHVIAAVESAWISIQTFPETNSPQRLISVQGADQCDFQWLVLAKLWVHTHQYITPRSITEK